jgi:hypothetical protein
MMRCCLWPLLLLLPQAALQELGRTCGRPLETQGGIKPTLVFSRNRDVDDTNSQELAKLPPNEPTTFKAVDTVSRQRKCAGAIM